MEFSDPNRQPVQWRVSEGGNGHFYMAVTAPAGLSWDRAEVLAEMAGGYLATITSAQENAFVFSLIQDPIDWNVARGPRRNETRADRCSKRFYCGGTRAA